MKDLPKVFAGTVGDINNTQELFYGGDRNIPKQKNNLSIVKKINNIFAAKDHVYKSKVLITLNSGGVEKTIVGKNNTHLITIDGELIRIIDILDIKKIN